MLAFILLPHLLGQGFSKLKRRKERTLNAHRLLAKLRDPLRFVWGSLGAGLEVVAKARGIHVHTVLYGCKYMGLYLYNLYTDRDTYRDTYTYMHACTHVYIYIYTETERERES